MRSSTFAAIHYGIVAHAIRTTERKRITRSLRRRTCLARKGESLQRSYRLASQAPANLRKNIRRRGAWAREITRISLNSFQVASASDIKRRMRNVAGLKFLDSLLARSKDASEISQLSCHYRSRAFSSRGFSSPASRDKGGPSG